MPGKFGRQLVKGDMKYEDYGTIEAHCAWSGARRWSCPDAPSRPRVSEGPVRGGAVPAPVAGGGRRRGRRPGARRLVSTAARDPPDLALLFVTPPHAGALEDAARAVRDMLRPGALLGCAAVSVVGGGREVEQSPGVSLWAATRAR